jgi:hypothetical protein
MAKINKDNLAFLGLDFQYRLILQLIKDRKFGENIIDMLSPEYFEDSYLKIIVATLLDAHNKYDIIPDIGTLKSRLLEYTKDEIERNTLFSQLRRIEEAELNDTF